MRLVGPLETESRLLDVDFENGGRGSVADLLLRPFLPLSVTVGEAGKTPREIKGWLCLKETKCILRPMNRAYAIRATDIPSKIYYEKATN